MVKSDSINERYHRLRTVIPLEKALEVEQKGGRVFTVAERFEYREGEFKDSGTVFFNPRLQAENYLLPRISASSYSVPLHRIPDTMKEPGSPRKVRLGAF